MRWQEPQRRMPFSVFQLHAPQFKHRAGMWTTIEAVVLSVSAISLFARASATVFFDRFIVRRPSGSKLLLTSLSPHF
jgi:hypothetical protein